MQLVTLAKYQQAIGDTSAANAAKHTEAIEDASAAIIAASGRDFGAPFELDTDREFSYAGDGILEIDDATAVNSVTYLPNSSPLGSTLWRAKWEGPRLTPEVFTYLELPAFRQRPETGLAEGFTRNLDVYLSRSSGFFQEVQVRVNADWGWPVIPDDIQRATIWAAQSFERSTPAESGLASESVAEVARAYFQEESNNEGTRDALPQRVLAVLDPYQRHSL